jgi:hypothetical protein
VEAEAEEDGAGLADFATLGAALMAASALGAAATAEIAAGIAGTAEAAVEGVPEEEVEEATLAIVIDCGCVWFILLV